MTISVEMQYPPFKTFIDNFKENVQETEFGFMLFENVYLQLLMEKKE